MAILVFLCLASSYSPDLSILTGEGGITGEVVPFPETDDIVDSYAYNQAEQMSTIAGSFSECATIDDFDMGSPAEDIFICGYNCWGVTTSSIPTTLEFLIVEYSGGQPVGAPLSQETYSVQCIDTGFTYYEYTVWYACLDLPDFLDIPHPCWLGSHRNDGMDWFPIGGLTVSGSEGYRTQGGWSWEPFSSSIEYGDLFKIIYGSTSDLDRYTWAKIKATY